MKNLEYLLTLALVAVILLVMVVPRFYDTKETIKTIQAINNTNLLSKGAVQDKTTSTLVSIGCSVLGNCTKQNRDSFTWNGWLYCNSKKVKSEFEECTGGDDCRKTNTDPTTIHQGKVTGSGKNFTIKLTLNNQTENYQYTGKINCTYS
ncbi:Uncharacterised protein [uncultured archaeon]|nr:Uncharacterised protein [uncultured archaeon]